MTDKRIYKTLIPKFDLEEQEIDLLMAMHNNIENINFFEYAQEYIRQYERHMAGGKLRSAKNNAIYFIGKMNQILLEHHISFRELVDMEDSAIRHIENLHSTHEIGTYLAIYAHEMQEFINKALAEQIPTSYEFQPVLDYIKNHLRENLSTSKIASACGYSRTYLSKRFKEQYGFGLREYRQKCRLAEAAYMLKSTNIPICEIGRMLQFSTPSYFSTAFCKEYGMTPSVYRKNLQKQK